MTPVAAQPLLDPGGGEFVHESARFGRTLRPPRVAAFEQAIAATHASAASNRTPALHLTSPARGKGCGDRMIGANR